MGRQFEHIADYYAPPIRHYCLSPALSAARLENTETARFLSSPRWCRSASAQKTTCFPFLPAESLRRKCSQESPRKPARRQSKRRPSLPESAPRACSPRDPCAPPVLSPLRTCTRTE